MQIFYVGLLNGMVGFINLAVSFCALFSACVELRVSPEWLSGFKRLKAILKSRQQINKQCIEKRVKVYFDG